MNLIHKTKTWLLDNNILVPDDWVTACVEWIQEEHQVPYINVSVLMFENDFLGIILVSLEAGTMFS